MAGVIKNHLGGRVFSTVTFGAGRQKERVVLSPDGQGWRPMGSEIFLKLRIKLNVGLIITEKIELNLGALRPVQQRLVERHGFRSDMPFGIFDPAGVLKMSSLPGKERSQRVPIFLAGIVPIGANRRPTI